MTRGEPAHGHVSKAARAWRAAHLAHTKRADESTQARDDKTEADRAAESMHNQTKGK